MCCLFNRCWYTTNFKHVASNQNRNNINTVCVWPCTYLWDFLNLYQTHAAVPCNREAFVVAKARNLYSYLLACLWQNQSTCKFDIVTQVLHNYYMHKCTFTCNTVVPGSTMTDVPSTNTSRRLLAAAVAVAVVRTFGTEKKNHKMLLTCDVYNKFRDRLINYQPMLAILKVFPLTNVSKLSQQSPGTKCNPA